MRNIVCFSGGKDSTALLLWAKENLPEFTAVFCDTGWEHPLTYAYVEEVNQTLLSGNLVYLRSDQYANMEECWIDHHMFPNNQARFCTEDMKIVPLHKFIEAQEDEVTTYQGVRADESHKRGRMREEEWVDAAGGYWMKRPIFRWTAEQVFAFMAERGVPPNPLYKMGMSRVGCWPCIHANLRDMKAYLHSTPEIKDRLIEQEKKMREKTGAHDRTFFRHGFIPERFCSMVQITKAGDTNRIPSADDVFRYIESVDENQLPMFPAKSCMSVYNLCE
jgi:3'-phosphoadenosine 5'-phosphosulfate sulfotransferase (PAPS reductase)/FAD synthetase